MLEIPSILTLLKELDDKLGQSESLIICGGGAVALAFGGTRQTYDVDVIAPLPLSVSLKAKVKEIALEMGLDPNWLNDSAKGFVDYLLPSWEDRLISVDLGFQYLDLQSLGKVDLIMMKLKAGREKDMADIEVMGLTQEDVELILVHLKQIFKFDKKTALNITLQLKEWGFGS